MDEINTKYTFWNLINQYNIEIPIMQRDYAQGRSNSKTSTIRADLLDSLYHSINDDSNIDFDFVYGTVDNGTLFPLDGQQRLTTLFLLHWYVAMKEDKLTDTVKEILKKFTYSTRISSREFCQSIVEYEFDLNADTIVSEIIKDANWYYRTWDKDPTIKAMLVMLDSIHAKFFTSSQLFHKLVRDIADNPPITFSFISLDDYALTDDLYIKMNARGKALSDFENFKAKFLQHLKHQGFEYKPFEDAIDIRWTDLLWDYRSNNNTIDDAFLHFFSFITEMIYAEDAEAKDMNSPYRTFNMNVLINTYNTNDKVMRLYEMFDLWKNKAEINDCMNSIFSTAHEIGKTKLFEQNCNLLDRCLKGDNLSYPNKVLLYMIMRRVSLYKQQDKLDPGLADYARVIRNLVSGVRTLTKYSYQSDFRYGRHAVPFVQFIVANLLEADDVYEVLLSLPATSAIREGNLKDEQDKAELIKANPVNKERIHKLEDLEMFKGSIYNVIHLLTESSVDLSDLFAEIFTADNTVLAARALLSIGDYGIRLGGSALGDRVYFGSRGNWHTILTAKQDHVHSDILCSLIRQYHAAEAEGVKAKLNKIIELNFPKMGSDTWRYHFVKYPGMLDAPVMQYAFSDRSETDVGITRMDSSTLNGYHIMPYYQEIALRLGHDKCVLDDCRGKNSEEGIIVLTCGLRIYLDYDSTMQVSYDDADYDATVNKVINKFDKITNNGEKQDCVERGLLLCNMLHRAITSQKQK